MSIVNFLHGLLPLANYDTSDEGVWSQLPPMRVRRHGCSAATLGDDTLVIMGGHNGESETSSVDVYKCNKDGVWSAGVPGALMKERRLGSVAATLKSDANYQMTNECIIVVGGHNGRVLKSAERYHPRLDMWTESQCLPNNNRGLFNAAAVAVKERLYVIGGHDGQSPTNQMHVFDSNFCTWTPAPAMREKRFHFGATAHGKYIYVVGGEGGDGAALRSMEWYDPDSRTWSPLPPCFSKRKGCVVAGVGGYIYVFGGHDGYQVLNSCERYDPLTECWSPIPSMKYKRFGSAIAVIRNKIFVIGGFDGTTAIDSVEEFTVPTRVPATPHGTTDQRDNSASEGEEDEISNSSSLIREASQSASSEPPDELQCPITGDLMMDPVVASDGHSYEREAIEEWFRRFSASAVPRSPSTNGPIERKLFPNHNLKSLCRQYGGKHPAT